MTPQASSPKSQRGQAAHALLREGRMTCIDCHFNLVHAPVPPSWNSSAVRRIGAKRSSTRMIPKSGYRFSDKIMRNARS